MQTDLLWKVCRVADIHTARLCADIGTDLIGLHAIEGITASSARSYRRIAIELAEYYPDVLPIVVTKLSSFGSLVSLIVKTGARGVQVHAPIPPDHLAYLSTRLRHSLRSDLRVLAVASASDPDCEQRMRHLSDLGELVSCIVIDSAWRGGTGKPTPVRRLRQVTAAASPTPVLIGGGLHAGNINRVVQGLRPSGVDIQSGLEMRRNGKPKDPLKLLEFSRSIHKPGHRQWVTPRRRLVAASLTSVAPNRLRDTLERFVATDIDIIHLDHSDGSLTPGFAKESFEAASVLRDLSTCMPYDLHAFVEDSSGLKRLVEAYREVNPLLRVASIHIANASQDSLDKVKRFVHDVREIDVEPGIAAHSTGFTMDSIRIMSRTARILGIVNVTLVLHSLTHDISRTREHDLVLLKALRSEVTPSARFLVGVDRDVNPGRLEILREASPNLAVSGTFLTETTRPQGRIDALRSLLTGSR